MSMEENKAIIRRLVEVWNTGEVGPLEELIVPDYVMHYRSTATRPESGPEWYRQVVTDARAEVSDLHFTVEDLLADGDKVVWRWTASGTHSGESKTPWGTTVPPTGKKVAWTHIIITRIAGGRIAEDWMEEDEVTYWQQVGAIPSPST